ncbi:hypothetical protein PGTUg99_026076 [Puccinia graminis f. sp. tritici]|uniref:Uncharacterized protein n=1 Tax=Puccinia graminis f. sp. tritici TaxID=56615 RepID=A0A5B0NK47_PUCGR|nr:hypothetical protein PGTUg99_026076 [Puccinia graminis f. sp. tritici]
MFDAKVCNATNTEIKDESDFFSDKSINWDAHRIGWVIAGSMAILTIIISTYTVCQHARHYHRPSEQRQIIRIILMPPVYAVISFFSYRFFRAFTYYQLVETGFVFSILEKHGVIKGSLYWTPTNVSEGLQALCTTIEMVVFSVVMIFSFSAESYKALKPGQTTSGWKSFFHSQNYGDFLFEAYISLCFFKDYAMRKPYTRSASKQTKATGLDFDQAYSWADGHSAPAQEQPTEVTDDKSYRLGLMHSIASTKP